MIEKKKENDSADEIEEEKIYEEVETANKDETKNKLTKDQLVKLMNENIGAKKQRKKL